MSPLNVGGKYHSRLHLGRENSPIFVGILSCGIELYQTGFMATTMLIMRPVQKAGFLMRTAISSKNGKFCTIMIDIRASAGRYFFNGVTCSMKVRPLFKGESFV